MSGNRRLWLRAMLCASLLAGGCTRNEPEPAVGSRDSYPHVLTSTLQIHSLTVDPNNGIWAATAGGVLYWRGVSDSPQQWTSAYGLPDNDVISVNWGKDGVCAHSVLGNCCLKAGVSVAVMTSDHNCVRTSPQSQRKSTADLPSGCRPVIADVLTPHGELLASALGLWLRTGDKWSAFSLPSNSPASHVSALLCIGKVVYAGLYGDGLYKLQNRIWTRIELGLSCRYITCLAARAGELVVGTEDHGAICCDPVGHYAAEVRRLTCPGLPNADIESIAEWGGYLWLASFDHGIMRLPCDKTDGKQIAVYSAIKNPRELIPARGALYCRDADSKLYAYNGVAWRESNLAHLLPRRDVYCCFVSGGQFYIGGWGGWACVTKSRTECHFTDANLAGQVVTCIVAHGTKVWIGTQGKGLLCWDHGSYTEYHEAAGLTDDWVTAISCYGSQTLVGTYTGGALMLRNGRFTQVLKANGYDVRSIVVSGDGIAYAATPIGTYDCLPGGSQAWRLLRPDLCGGPEAQCLFTTRHGIWIGGRTSISWVGNSDCGT